MTTDENITLRQGLEQFRTENAAYLSHLNAEVSEEAQAFFRAHDIAHVVFHCDTSLFGEGAVKIWTIFGTTLGFWRHFSAYKKANALQLSRSFQFKHFVPHLWKLITSIPTLIYRARRMHKPWPWLAFESYLDRPLTEIRKEFNIYPL